MLTGDEIDGPVYEEYARMKESVIKEGDFY